MNCRLLDSLQHREPIFIINCSYWFNKQEARGAADKAYEVAKVDEGVNRAVAASNRAANAARVAAVKAAQKQMHQVNNESFAIPVM